eukprot:1801934-Amphidinium_carterae.1
MFAPLALVNQTPRPLQQILRNLIELAVRGSDSKSGLSSRHGGVNEATKFPLPAGALHQASLDSSFNCSQAPVRSVSHHHLVTPRGVKVTPHQRTQGTPNPELLFHTLPQQVLVASVALMN